MYIMDDVLDLMDSLGETLEKSKRQAKLVLQGEGGFSTLVTVLVILALGAIIITPLLVMVITGHRAGEAHERVTNRYYAADTGIQDAMWRVSTGDLPTWMEGTWGSDQYQHDPFVYSLPEPINGCEVNVEMSALWLLEGLETLPNGATPHQGWLTFSNVITPGHYEIVMVCEATNKKIDRIGVYLPSGYTYTPGSSDLEKLPTNHKAYMVPTVQEHRGGHVVIWDYGTTKAVTFSELPGGETRKVIGFDYTPATTMRGTFSWSRSLSSDIYLSWSGDIKIFQISATATDLVTGLSTTIIAGNVSDESVGTSIAFYGDYAVSGNALLRDVTGDDFRERLYQSSPGGIYDVPDSATPRRIFLYWSGFKHDPQNVTLLTKDELLSLAIEAHVNQVSLKARLTETSPEIDLGTVVAQIENIQVVPNRLGGTPDGWSYSCRVDVTDLLKTSLGSNYVGNAIYTVGHAEIETGAPTDRTRQGVWGTEASNVFVVGVAGTISHYDGASWSSMESGTGRTLNGVWGSSATDVWVVGERSSSGGWWPQYGYTILHTTNGGETWTNTGSTTGGQTMYGVWGSASNNVIAVGAGGTILRYNGSWSSMSSGTTSTLYGVWGSAPNNVIAVGAGGTIRYYNGSGWISMTSGTSNHLYGVWGNSASNVIAVGAYGTIRRYNGTAWAAMSVPTGFTGTLRGVWGTADGNNVFAVGDGGEILYWDGKLAHPWELMSSDSQRNLYGIWGSSASDVYAVGEIGTTLHYDGSTWTSLFGACSLYEWKDGHPGSNDLEGIVASTDCPLGDPAPDTSYSWHIASCAWSILVLYTSPETLPHQMYLYDTFRYNDSYNYLQFDLDGFLAPASVATEDNAVRMTCFVSEGDEEYSPENVYIKAGTKGWQLLSNGTSGSPIRQNNVWNKLSGSGGTLGNPPDCVDLDTFIVPKGYMSPGDCDASIWMGDHYSVITTQGSGAGMDAWNLVYIILSFRSDIVANGLVTYIVQ